MNKRKTSLICLIFIGLMIMQTISVGMPTEGKEIEIEEPKSSGTFTIENHSNKNLNVSLYEQNEYRGEWTFENDEPGSSPFLNYNGVNYVIKNAFGRRSILNVTGIADYRGAYKSILTNKYGVIQIEFSLYRTNLGGCAGILLNDSFNQPGFVMYMLDSGKINLYDGSAQSIELQSYAINTWYHFKVLMDYNTQKLSLWIDGVLKASDFNFNKYCQSFYLFSAHTTRRGSVYLDSIDFSFAPGYSEFRSRSPKSGNEIDVEYWKMHYIPDYNVLCHSNQDKTISTSLNNYYIFNHDLNTLQLYEVKNGSSYQFIPNLFKIQNEGCYNLNVSLYEQNEYQAIYSFQNETAGATPWINVSGTSYVMSNALGRRTILNITENAYPSSLTAKFNFDAISSDFILEFWIYITNNNRFTRFKVQNSEIENIFFALTFIDDSLLQIYGVGTYDQYNGDYLPNTWMHFTIKLNFSNRTFSVLKDGLKLVENFKLRNEFGHADYISVQCDKNIPVYLDGVDFSTDPTYVYGRNKEPFPYGKIDEEFWSDNYFPEYSTIIHGEDEKDFIAEKKNYYIIAKEITTGAIYEVSNSSTQYIYNPNTLILGADIVWINNIPYFSQSAKISPGLKEVSLFVLGKLRIFTIYFNESNNILNFHELILRFSNCESNPIHCEFYKNSHFDGALSFDEYENGSLPNNVTLLNQETEAYVVESYLGHDKVLGLKTKNYGGGVRLAAEFEDEGSIEFWIYSKKGSTLAFTSEDEFGSSLGFVFYIYSDLIMTTQKQIPNALVVNSWNHFVIEYNKSLGFYNLSINFNRILVNETFHNPNQNPNPIAAVKFSLMYKDEGYIDSFDTSAYLGYYLYRSFEKSKNLSLYELIDEMTVGSYSTIEIFDENIYYYKIFDWNRNLIDEGLFNASHLSYISKIRPKMVYFSIFDISGLGLDASTVRFYINGTRTEFRRHDILGSHVHLLVLDYFNATLFNSTISIEEINEFNIHIPVFTLGIFNNYTDPMKIKIKREGLGFDQLEQQLAPQSSIHFRFLANVEYTIEFYHLNDSIVESRIVNLTENRYLSFGFYSSSVPSVLIEDSPLWFKIAFFVALCATIGVISVVWIRQLNKKYKREVALTELEVSKQFRRTLV